MTSIIAPPALKHGLDESNMAAIFLEVGYVEGELVHVIVHAMHAREKFLR